MAPTLDYSQRGNFPRIIVFCIYLCTWYHFFSLNVDPGGLRIRRDTSPSPSNLVATFGRLRKLELTPRSLCRKCAGVVPCSPATKHKSLAAIFAAQERESFSASCGPQSLPLRKARLKKTWSSASTEKDDCYVETASKRGHVFVVLLPTLFLMGKHREILLGTGWRSLLDTIIIIRAQIYFGDAPLTCWLWLRAGSKIIQQSIRGYAASNLSLLCKDVVQVTKSLSIVQFTPCVNKELLFNGFRVGMTCLLVVSCKYYASAATMQWKLSRGRSQDS